MSNPSTTTLYGTWRSRHHDQWSTRGLGSSADDYAYVVCDHRTGGRASLSWGYSLSQGPTTDAANRRLVRQQVDACLASLQGAGR